MPPRDPPQRPASGRGSAPPPPKPDTTSAPKSLPKGYVYDQWMKAHPKMRDYADLIWKWAGQYGVDPTYLAALIFFESGGNPVARSNKNAVGLAQIHMGTWRGSQTPWGETITEDWAQNPANSVRFAAWYLSQGVAQHGSYEDAYRNHYNPGYTGAGPFGSVPKAYVPKGGGLSPAESASVSVETSAAKQALTDPWVVVKKGKVSYAKGTEPPPNSLLYDGIPITKSQFLNAKRQIEETWISYTGQRPSDAQVANYLQRGWSTYHLTKVLVNSPGFVKSPVYKRVAPGYGQAAEGLMGEGERVELGLIRRAVMNNWSGDDLQAHLRKQQGYVTSNEFKQRSVTLSNVHESIMGTPDQGAMTAIQEATLAGWDVNQYAAWVRSTEQYQFSPEYQARAIGFLDSLGLFTGGQASLAPGQAPAGAAAPGPDDPRLAGRGGVSAPSSLVPRGV